MRAMNSRQKILGTDQGPGRETIIGDDVTKSTFQTQSLYCDDEEQSAWFDMAAMLPLGHLAA